MNPQEDLREIERLNNDYNNCDCHLFIGGSGNLCPECKCSLEDLFLTEEEEKIFYLKKLADKFILEPKEILFKLEVEMIETKDKFNELKKYFNNYKKINISSPKISIADLKEKVK